MWLRFFFILVIILLCNKRIFVCFFVVIKLCMEFLMVFIKVCEKLWVLMNLKVMFLMVFFCEFSMV